MTNSKSRIAGGTINPFKFVIGAPQISPSQQVALQATGGNVPLIGVGPEWTDNLPGTSAQPAQGYPAAVAGESVRVYETGEIAMLMVGSGYTVMPDTLLVSDASGNGIPLDITSSRTTAQWVGARAVESGVAGNVIQVQVMTYPF